MGSAPAADHGSRAARLPIFGEVHTGLLQHSTALSSAEARQLLGIVPGHQAQTFERPIQYARSPMILSGLDCDLMDASGAVLAHVVGTAGARVIVTGGHVLQATASVRLQHHPSGQRRAWSHYLSQPGMAHLTGRTGAEQIAALELAFLRRPRRARMVDLGSISAALADHVQTTHPTLLDGQPPVRVGRTQVRWSARVGEALNIRFALENAQLRTIRLTVREQDLPVVAAFCEDVALHDWLLTSLLQVVDRTRATTDPRLTTNRLRPVLDHLVHLWMPSVRHNGRVAHLCRGSTSTPGSAGSGTPRQVASGTGSPRRRPP
ncbi:SCO2521 family protein [Luedemannella flava]